MSTHGCCFAEYGRKLDTLLEVEKRREKNYAKSQQLAEECERLNAIKS